MTEITEKVDFQIDPMVDPSLGVFQADSGATYIIQVNQLSSLTPRAWKGLKTA
jgi:hypothetical protein